jgi:hypothetical protein
MFQDFFDKGAVDRAVAEKVAPPPYYSAPVAAPAIVPDEFDPASFPFKDRVYRIHFKNGNSGEYAGAVLAHTFPFDPREVERIEHVEDVGR